MNSTDYTLCNLDSHTYTTPHHQGNSFNHSSSNNSSTENGGGGGGNHHSYSSHFNGISHHHNGHHGSNSNSGSNSTGNAGHHQHHHHITSGHLVQTLVESSSQPQYSSPGYQGGNTPGLLQHHQHQPGHHHHNSAQQCSSLPIEIQPSCGPPVTPYDSGGGGGVIAHTNGPGPQPYGPHYGQGFAPPSYYAQGPGLNGCLTPDLPTGHPGSPPGYPSPYPDHLAYGGAGGALIHPANPCSSPGVFLGSGGGGGVGVVCQNGGGPQGEGPVTTYKWMTVKRSQPKTQSTGEFVFAFFFYKKIKQNVLIFKLCIFRKVNPLENRIDYETFKNL